MEGSGLSAGDIMALTKDNDNFFGEGLWGVILLLIVAGVIGGNGFFGGRGYPDGASEGFISNQFTQRDLYNNNTNILDAKYDNMTGILENRYANALNTQNVISSQKDCCCETKILGLQNTFDLASRSDRNDYNNLLGNKDLTASIIADGQKTRELINQQYTNTLLEKINDLKAQVNNAEQSQYILSVMGKWHAFPSVPVSPYTYGTTYGTTIA